jgi:type II secretory pathway pseudopilin PulG
MEKNLKNAGVSLVEVLIAMFIIAMALFTIASVFPRMGQHRKVVNEVDQARIIAMEVLEGLQRFSETADDGDGPCYSGTVNTPEINSFLSENHPSPLEIGGASYGISVPTVECSGDINTVTILIEWKKAGKDHKINVTGAVK